MVVTGAGQKSTYCPVQIFRAISVKQGYDKLKIDCYLWDVERCRGVGNYVRPVRIERPCAETVIASSMIASIGNRSWSLYLCFVA